MPAPQFIQSVETADWLGGVASKASPTFPVLIGDVIPVVILVDSSISPAFSLAGGGLVWTRYPSALLGSAKAYIWAATANADTDIAVTVSGANTSFDTFGFVASTFRGSSGVGSQAGVARAGTVSDSGATSGGPLLNVNTSQPNSVLVVGCTDTNAVDGAIRIWRETAGPLTELEYNRTVGKFTNYIGYHANVRNAGTHEVGLLEPLDQTYAIVALEILTAFPDSPSLENVDMTGFPDLVLRTPPPEEVNQPDEGTFDPP